MPKFIYGKTSKSKLNVVCTDLCAIMYDALDTGIMDISIIEGHRDKAQQNRYFDIGKSKVRYPDGKHNKAPSEAVDAVPYINGKISWNKLHCCVLAGIILACAAKRGIKVRWGGCWSGDFENVGGQSLNDYVHFELVK